MAIRISSGSDEHVPGLEALWQECLAGDPLSASQSARSTLLLVASDGKEVIGSIMAGYDGHRGWIYALAVLPDYRFDQIATNLVIEAERQLTAIGCTKINLQIHSTNARVQQFYKTLGYETEDRVSMGKRLQYS